MKLSLTLLLLIISLISFSQECHVKGEKDWMEVEIRTYKEVPQPLDYNYVGENIMKNVSANSIDDLRPKQIENIKRMVAKYGACIVYVDFDNLMEVDYGLYFVWTDEASSPIKE